MLHVSSCNVTYGRGEGRASGTTAPPHDVCLCLVGGVSSAELAAETRGKCQLMPLDCAVGALRLRSVIISGWCLKPSRSTWVLFDVPNVSWESF